VPDTPEDHSMADRLPEFRYHPEPLATGAVEPSSDACLACGRTRGYVYTGPTYSEEETSGRICPWCIADGRAHAVLGATFVDEHGLGGDVGHWGRVPDTVVRELIERTPGFHGWQAEQWFTCCGDAAAFLGAAGKRELEIAGPGAIAIVRDGLGYDDRQWQQYFDLLDANGSPTAYLFRCLHCGKLGGYSDCH
jgi:uncharacterized protein